MNFDVTFLSVWFFSMSYVKNTISEKSKFVNLSYGYVSIIMVMYLLLIFPRSITWLSTLLKNCQIFKELNFKTIFCIFLMFNSLPMLFEYVPVTFAFWGYVVGFFLEFVYLYW